MSQYLAAILIVPAAIAFAGSFDSNTAVAEPAVQRAATQEPALRVKFDLARGRRWELHWDGVFAYDVASGELVRHVLLPGATFAAARDSCLPDILLGRSGAVIVSSNVQPRLWRISPARFEVEVYEIALGSDDDKDIGFGNLEWVRDESVLRASSAPGGTPWRIDLAAATAARLDQANPVDVACASR